LHGFRYPIECLRMNETPKRRGRPKGSSSFVKMNLKHLVSQLGRNANIMVSKKHLDQLEELDMFEYPIDEAVKPPKEPEEKIQFSINTFND